MAGTGAVSPTIVARAPKALLHDHLDGGLRPPTVVELARGLRLRRPAHDGCRGAGSLVP